MSRPQAVLAWPPALFERPRVRVPAPGKTAALSGPLVAYLFVVVQRISYRLQSFRNSRIHIKVFLLYFGKESRRQKNDQWYGEASATESRGRPIRRWPWKRAESSPVALVCHRNRLHFS